MCWPHSPVVNFELVLYLWLRPYKKTKQAKIKENHEISRQGI